MRCPSTVVRLLSALKIMLDEQAAKLCSLDLFGANRMTAVSAPARPQIAADPMANVD